MNVRLKTFVSIQKVNDCVIISGAFKEGDLYFNESSDMLDLLARLKTDTGLPYEDYKDNSFFSQLDSLGLLEEMHNHETRRHELFYDYIDYDIQVLKAKQILIFGAGAAGGTLTYLLAQQGFSHITCVDNDKVENSDVSKTMVYDKEDIGTYKVNAIKSRVCKNFGVSINSIVGYMKTIEDADKIIGMIKPDIVIYAIDPAPRFKLMLDKYCVLNNIPIIHASYSYEKIICGPCVVPHETACMIGYNKYWKARTLGNFDLDKAVRLFANSTIHPSISFNINTLAGAIVKDIIFCLGKRYEYVSTFNKQIIINMLNSEVTEIELSCQFCNDCIAKCSK